MSQIVGPSGGMVFRPAQRSEILGQKMVHVLRAGVMLEKNVKRPTFAAGPVMQ